MKEYDKTIIPLAQKLRKEMTPEERKLWYLFLKSYPLRFCRQKTIGRYIVDFYCAKAKLVIELDGTQHFETKGQQEDQRRTAQLEAMGLRVVRFSNKQINNEFDGVCQYIDTLVKNTAQGGQGYGLDRSMH